MTVQLRSDEAEYIEYMIDHMDFDFTPDAQGDLSTVSDVQLKRLQYFADVLMAKGRLGSFAAGYWSKAAGQQGP